MNLDVMKRLAKDLESITGLLESATHRYDDLVTEEAARANGQLPLPGIESGGEDALPPALVHELGVPLLLLTGDEVEIHRIDRCSISRTDGGEWRADVVISTHLPLGAPTGVVFGNFAGLGAGTDPAGYAPCRADFARLTGERDKLQARVGELEGDNCRWHEENDRIAKLWHDMTERANVANAECERRLKLWQETDEEKRLAEARLIGLQARVGELEGGIRTALAMIRYLPTAVERDATVRQVCHILATFVGETVGATRESPAADGSQPVDGQTRAGHDRPLRAAGESAARSTSSGPAAGSGPTA